MASCFQKTGEQPDVFNDRSTKLFKQADVSNKRVTKQF